ncbi:MAG: 4Fe-4S binding protein [Deltaproteobacteria bacterium]|nr:4Fe-4S binding protein [Deltaproteobacteria bacterium]
MNKQSSLKTILSLIFLIILIIVSSIFSNQLWQDKPETLPEFDELIISEEMTITEFGQANKLANPMLKEVFDLKTKEDLKKQLKEYGSSEQISSLIVKNMALAAEHSTKNWIKIPLKFGVWIIFLITLFLIFRKREISQTLRKRILFISILVFGVALGSGPSPMGTVKDAIHLYAHAGAIFPPRMIALAVFLLIVFLANKYICAWGCQAGTLQDLIFRINQTPKYKSVIGRQIKLPFFFTNTVRFLFLCVFTVVAFLWGIDIIDPVDPFKIYKPSFLGIIGSGFVGTLLLLSLFIYRPWCHLFCPFGLAGWLVEKISRVKISVDYETCIACQKCASSCPTTVMTAILKRDKKTIPDCFSCYTCTQVCPTDSIRFSTGKRTNPPTGHFDKKEKADRISS